MSVCSASTTCNSPSSDGHRASDQRAALPIAPAPTRAVSTNLIEPVTASPAACGRPSKSEKVLALSNAAFDRCLANTTRNTLAAPKHAAAAAPNGTAEAPGGIGVCEMIAFHRSELTQIRG